jgi:phosphoribosylanthranilate isomerase
VLKAIHVAAEGDAESSAGLLQRARELDGATPLFDTTGPLGGGTGHSFPWNLVREAAREQPVVVAGGLTCENVAACVRAARPYAVDVRSGVESERRKDARKLRAFVAAVREADAA